MRFRSPEATHAFTSRKAAAAATESREMREPDMYRTDASSSCWEEKPEPW